MWTKEDKQNLKDVLISDEKLTPSDVDTLMSRMEAEGYFEFYEPGDENLIDSMFEEFI